jgi:hypothetical protein
MPYFSSQLRQIDTGIYVYEANLGESMAELLSDNYFSGLPNNAIVKIVDKDGASKSSYRTFINNFTLTINAVGTASVAGGSGSGSKVFNVKDFGAKGDGVTDDRAAIQAAINALGVAGGGILYAPKGDYVINGDLVPTSTLQLLGDGRGATIFRVPNGNSARNSIFRYVNMSVPFSRVTIKGITFRGQWDNFQSELSANGLITLKNIDDLFIDECEFLYSRAFTLNINEVRNVKITNNVFSHSVRDMCAIWNAPNVIIKDNIFRHNDDDVISLQIENVTTVPVRSRAVITGNIMEDTSGISIQGTKSVTLSDNIFHRTKGQAFIITGSPAFGINKVSGHSVIVNNNVINDVIDRFYNVNGAASDINSRKYININGVTPLAGGLPVPPGEYTSTGAMQSPYDYYYTTAGVDNLLPVRMTEGIIISNNEMRRTLPAVANYSDWGFGQCFSKNGFVNTEVTDDMLNCAGIDLRIPIKDVSIFDNHIDTGRTSVRILSVSGHTITDYDAKNIIIYNNTLKGFTTAGIQWNAASLTHQDIIVENNLFDGDYRMVSSNRKTPLDGTYLADGDPTALAIAFCGGAIVKNNTFRNVCRVTESGASVNFTYFEGNIVIADPVSGAGFSTSNKGVGNIPNIGSGDAFWLLARNCDPASAEYDRSYGRNLKVSNGVPNNGKWLEGTVVKSRDSGITVNGVSSFFLRTTTGSNHVVGTDWSELRIPYGENAPYGSNLRFRSGNAGVGSIEAFGTAANINIELVPKGTNADVRVTTPFGLRSYDVASLPAAANHNGDVVHVSNGNAGQPCLAVSNGTNWLRIGLGTAVSAT